MQLLLITCHFDGAGFSEKVEEKQTGKIRRIKTSFRTTCMHACVFRDRVSDLSRCNRDGGNEMRLIIGLGTFTSTTHSQEEKCV